MKIRPRLVFCHCLFFAFTFLVGWLPAQDALQEESVSRDALNATRLETIFGSVDELKSIAVTVTNGVVRLAGNTTSEEDREKAESVAKGLPDVVYVDNDITVSTDIKERLSPSVSRLNELVKNVRALLPLIAVAFGVVVVFWLLARLLAWAFRISPLLGDNKLLRAIVEKVLRLVVLILGLYLALEILGATAIVGAVLGAAGVAGLAISFAFRDIIENFLASVLLSLRQPFRIKDTVDINGASGKVVRLTSSETVLMTADGNHVRIPNADVFKGRVINYTRNPERRFDVVVGVGTDEDLVRAEEIGLDTLRGLPGVLSDPPPKCLIDELGDSNVSMRFHAWIDQSVTDFSKIRSHATRLIKMVFDHESIGMPNPIYDVNVRNAGEPSPRPAETGVGAKQRSNALIEKAHRGDTSPDTHIDEQIDSEKTTEGEEDLLSAESPVARSVS